MIIPVSDAPNPRIAPWMTLLLIAANVLVFVAFAPAKLRPADQRDPAFREYVEAVAAERQAPIGALRGFARSLTAYDLVVFKHGLRPARPELVDVLTGMFLHGGFWHLAANMLFLWIYGNNVEAQLGRLAFLALYLLTGAAAALGDAALRLGSDIPAVGASGAISGVLGLYFVWFPRNHVRLLVLFFPFFVDFVEVPARVVLGLYLIVDNMLPWLLTSASSGVAYGAHLGGFVAGVALALALRPLTRRRGGG